MHSAAPRRKRCTTQKGGFTMATKLCRVMQQYNVWRFRQISCFRGRPLLHLAIPCINHFVFFMNRIANRCIAPSGCCQSVSCIFCQCSDNPVQTGATRRQIARSEDLKHKGLVTPDFHPSFSKIQSIVELSSIGSFRRLQPWATHTVNFSYSSLSLPHGWAAYDCSVIYRAITPDTERRFSVGISNASIMPPRRTVHLQARIAVPLLSLECFTLLRRCRRHRTADIWKYPSICLLTLSAASQQVDTPLHWVDTAICNAIQFFETGKQ